MAPLGGTGGGPVDPSVMVPSIVAGAPDPAAASVGRLANPPRLADPEKGRFALYRMPTYWKAGPKTADISKLH